MKNKLKKKEFYYDVIKILHWIILKKYAYSHWWNIVDYN